MLQRPHKQIGLRKCGTTSGGAKHRRVLGGWSIDTLLQSLSPVVLPVRHQMVMDESIFEWCDKDQSFGKNGCSHVTKIAHKQKSVCMEMKNLADCDTWHHVCHCERRKCIIVNITTVKVPALLSSCVCVNNIDVRIGSSSPIRRLLHGCTQDIPGSVLPRIGKDCASHVPQSIFVSGRNPWKGWTRRVDLEGYGCGLACNDMEWRQERQKDCWSDSQKLRDKMWSHITRLWDGGEPMVTHYTTSKLFHDLSSSKTTLRGHNELTCTTAFVRVVWVSFCRDDHSKTWNMSFWHIITSVRIKGQSHMLSTYVLWHRICWTTRLCVPLSPVLHLRDWDMCNLDEVTCPHPKITSSCKVFHH